MKIKILVLFILLLFPSWVLGATYTLGPGQTYETFAAFFTAVTPSPDDIIDGGGYRYPETVTMNASGTSGHPIIVQRVSALNFDDNGNDYIVFRFDISSGSAGDGFSIAGAGNEILNCVVYNSVGDGVEITDDATIKNTIFETIGGSDINENGGTATVDGNFADSDGDPQLVVPDKNDFRVLSSSPVRGVGTDIWTGVVSVVSFNGVSITDGAGALNARLRGVVDIGGSQGVYLPHPVGMGVVGLFWVQPLVAATLVSLGDVLWQGSATTWQGATVTW